MKEHTILKIHDIEMIKKICEDSGKLIFLKSHYYMNTMYRILLNFNLHVF